jgi:hypothetical protein
MTENDMPVNNIKIEGADGSQTKLKRFPPEEGIRMLGARHTLTMQQETELRYLKGKTTKFAYAISACPLRPHESMICYKCIYIPSVTYPFATTSLSLKQCKDIQTILMSRLLPRLGYHQISHTQLLLDQRNMEQ